MLSSMPSARKSNTAFVVGLLLVLHGFFVVTLLVAVGILATTWSAMVVLPLASGP